MNSEYFKTYGSSEPCDDLNYEHQKMVTWLRKEENELKKLEPQIKELKEKKEKLEEKIEELPMYVKYQCGDELETLLNMIDEIMHGYEKRKAKYIEEKSKLIAQ